MSSLPVNDWTILRGQFRADKAALLACLADRRFLPRSIHTVLHQLSDLADALLITLWHKAGFDDSFALVAVGGFGRQQLFPYSDIDVLVLLPSDQSPDDDPALKVRIEGFISACWDAGLEIGSSVRNVSDCLAQSAADVTVQTALLEARLITGCRGLLDDLHRQFVATIDPRAFFVAKTLEMRQRHTQFENTPYALEPDCKESPGGLRDLHVVLWVARAAGFGGDWKLLAQNGLTTAFELKQIMRYEALLHLIRARLHLHAKRREDRLVFDLQSVLAQSFGYQPPDLATDARAFARPSEELMRHYYLAAKAVTQLNQILLLNIEARLNPSSRPLQPLNEHFLDNAGMVEVASDDLYHRHPHAILQTFLVYQTYAGLLGLSARTLRALYNARPLMDGKFRRDPVNRATFCQILMQQDGITHAMRLMNQTSVLGRYLWAFRHTVGQMQHDLFHVYTVDQHILMVLRNLRRFFIVEHAHEYPFCSQLASDWHQPWVLYTAALFHDIAKGRGGDHSQLGAVAVRRFCRQSHLSHDDSQLIEFIVREHLTMSRIAQKSDISDPDVITQFAKQLGSERYLTALYLFTVADIRATSPKVWNAWKGKLLEDLYRATLRALGGHTPDPDTEVKQRQHEALVLLAPYALPFGAHTAFWNTLDVGYFMRHDASVIAWHTRQLSRHLCTTTPVVRAHPSPVGEGLQVVVYTPDQADLFARICGYFDHGGFSILDARIHTTQKGYALDTFEVITTHLGDHYRELISMIQSELSKVIATAGPLPEPARSRVSRRVKNFPITPRVMLKPDDRAQRWLLYISASDKVGLLYCVARVLARHHIDLQLARVNTLGERVEDTFVIQGAALQYSRGQIEIETELLAALA